MAKPLYFYLSQKERNLDPMRREVQSLLAEMSTEASRKAKDTISKSESALQKTQEAISRARKALNKARDEAVLKSSSIYDNAKSKLNLAKVKVASGDYVAFLEAKPIADESIDLADNATDEAHREREHYEGRRAEKVKNAWRSVPGAIIGVPLLFGILGSIGGCIIALSIEGAGGTTEIADTVFEITLTVSIIIGFLLGIGAILSEFKN